MANYNSFVFKGHGTSERTGGYDPGATAHGRREYDLVSAIVNAAKSYLDKSSLEIHYDENNYSDIDLSGNEYSAKCGISVHINAGGGTGTEIFVPNKETFLGADFELAEEVSSLLGIPNRGIKSRNYDTNETVRRQNGVAVNAKDYYGEIREAWNRGISLSILEIGFIDNVTDLHAIEANINEIGWLVAKYVAGLCGQVLTRSKTHYRVQVGFFGVKENAERLANQLKEAGFPAYIIEEEK